jgi:hypothetical protein
VEVDQETFKILEDVFAWHSIGCIQNPLHDQFEKWGNRDDPAKEPSGKGKTDMKVVNKSSCALRVKGVWERYEKEYLPIVLEIKDINMDRSLTQDEQRAALDVCTRKKMSIIAEEWKAWYKGPHEFLWVESGKKKLSQTVKNVKFWREYHSAQEFFTFGCVLVGEQRESSELVTEDDQSEALVSLTQSLSLSPASRRVARRSP